MHDGICVNITRWRRLNCCPLGLRKSNKLYGLYGRRKQKQRRPLAACFTVLYVCCFLLCYSLVTLCSLQGGYKIELLEGSVVKYTLTSPGGAFVGSDDTTYVCVSFTDSFGKAIMNTLMRHTIIITCCLFVRQLINNEGDIGPTIGAKLLVIQERCDVVMYTSVLLSLLNNKYVISA